MHGNTRGVHIAGVTPYPSEKWMVQIARNITMIDVGFLSERQYLIHDRDRKFCPAFIDTIEAVHVGPVKLPAQRPELNAYAERWARAVKEKC